MANNTIDLEYGENHTFKMLYDSPYEGENKNGKWYMYTVEEDGKEVKFFAPSPLHSKLEEFGKGDVVEVRKYKKDGKTLFYVSGKSGSVKKEKREDVSSGGSESTYSPESVWLYSYVTLLRGVKKLEIEYDLPSLTSAATGMFIERMRSGLKYAPEFAGTAKLNALAAALGKDKFAAMKKALGLTSAHQLLDDEAVKFLKKLENSAEVVSEPEPPAPEPVEEDEDDDLPF